MRIDDRSLAATELAPMLSARYVRMKST